LARSADYQTDASQPGGAETEEPFGMRARIAVVAAAVLLLGVPAAAGAATPAPSTPAAGPPQALAVQPAASGTLRRVRGSPRVYDLVLRGVSPTLEAFDDSPGKRTQRIGIQTLFDVLFRYAGVPRKNAAISVGRRSMAVTLLRGSYDRPRHVARYRVRALRGARVLPRRLARPAIFIDDFGGWSCHGNLNNSTSLDLNPAGWDDPGSSQRMTSDPGFAASNTATDWESSGVFLGTGCAVGVGFTSTDGSLSVGLVIAQAVTFGFVGEVPFVAPIGDGVTCLLSGPLAYRYRCDQLWNRMSGMTRDASWQLLPA
jgi:hypothetical protein